MGIRIRPAKPDEADLLTEIACAAKAHWGYTAAQVLADITALRILSIAGLFWLALAVPPDPAVAWWIARSLLRWKCVADRGDGWAVHFKYPERVRRHLRFRGSRWSRSSGRTSLN